MGLYGDPDSTWGIGLELAFADDLDVDGLASRAEALVLAHPHLGTRVAVEVVDGPWTHARQALLGRPYEPGEPMVRVAVGDRGRTLFVAAHHGVCDGLGLVAIGSALTARTMTSNARGVGARRPRHGFLRRSVTRVLEAARHPPPRFQGDEAGDEGQPPDGVDNCEVAVLPRQHLGSVAMCLAVSRAFADRGGRGDALVVLGVSRRAPGAPAPDRQTGYLRLRVPASASAPDIARRLGQCAPEPRFPETSLFGLAPRLVQLLRGRLGATATVSNLGPLEGPGLWSAAMFPALSGPHAVALGFVSTPSTTTVTVRTRASEFGQDDTRNLLDGVVRHLTDSPDSSRQ